MMSMHRLLGASDRASIALDRENPEKTVDLLPSTSPYEPGSTELVQTGTMYPVYLCEQRRYRVVATIQFLLAALETLPTMRFCVAKG